MSRSDARRRRAPIWSRRVVALRDASVRARERMFVVEGVRFLCAARDHGATIEALVVSEALLRSVVGQTIARRLRAEGVPVERVSPERFRELSVANRASGVIAVVRQTWVDAAALGELDRPWLAIGNVRSPGNVGTLLRTLAAIDGGGAFVFGRRFDPFTPDFLRATMGALFSVRLVRTTVAELARFACERAAGIVGASPDARLDFRDADYGAAWIVLVGNERKGLADDERALCDRFVRIPMSSRVDSLNVSVAGSLILYEAVRGRAVTSS